MKKFGILTVAATALVMGSVQPAFGVAQLRLSSGGDVFTITDGGLGDLNGAAGAVTFIGDVGSFEINVSTGLSKPALGSANEPHTDLNSVNTSTSAGSIVIEFTDDGFTGTQINQFLASVGGTTGGSVSFQTYAGTAPFERAILLTDLNFGASPFAGSDSSGAGGLSNPFSLTMVATITHGAGTRTSSFDHELTTSVPEAGSTLALLGLSLSALGLVARRRS